MNKIIGSIIIVTLALNLGYTQTVEMADSFRGEGKIYVVVAVVMVMLVALFLYLMRIDRKLTNLEKEK